MPAILALAGAGFLIPSSADAVIAFNDGDVILGFRATGGQGASTAYLLNLGGAASIANASLPIAFNIGPIATDLNAIFGINWFNRADVLWGVSGVQKLAGNGFAGNTMFATRSDAIDSPVGTNTTTPWTIPSGFAAGTPAGKIQSAGQKYGTGTTGSVAGTDQMESIAAPGALIQPISQSNSYASFQPFGANTTGASAYSYFVDATGIEGTFANGAPRAVLDFYRLTPAPGSPPAPFVGNFTITNAGQVTFFPAGVPEPSAAVALALGGSLLAMRRRRVALRAR